jgi:sugar lactone lactonase YvrE/DNA-binding IclR family transcriptional regulator
MPANCIHVNGRRRETMKKAIQGAGALLKSLDVLEEISASGTPPSVGELATRLAMPRPTVHRIVAALEERGLVRFDPASRGFRLGFHLFELAHKAWADVDLRGAAREPLDRLRELSREVVVLGIRAGHGFVVTDRRESLFGVRPATMIGQTEPLTSSAFGLAILTALGEDEEAELGAEIEEIAGRDRGRDGLHAYRSSMRLASARGYAIHVGEGGDAVASVAAPILDFLGRPIAAIGVLGPASRFSIEQLHALAPDVIDAARRTTSNAGNSLQSIEPRPRPIRPREATIEVFRANTLLGKTPRWRPEDGGLFVADILGPSILAVSQSGAEALVVARPDMGVLCGWTADGGMVVADSNGVAVMDRPGAPHRQLAAMPDGLRGSRLNDAAIDPAGRVWFTSMNVAARPGEGGIFRVDGDHVVSVVENLSVPSGLAWSLDGREIYIAEASRRVAYRAPFDIETGRIGDLVRFIQIAEVEGTPDGLAVDMDGFIWIALWDGWSVARYDRAGNREQTVVLPVPRPTDLCFGGNDSRTLFVTTARVRLSPRILSEAPISGEVIAIRVPVGGLSPTSAVV